MSARRTEFTLVREGPRHAVFDLVSTRTVRTIEGRVADSFLARSLPTAALFLALITLAEVTTIVAPPRYGMIIHAATLILMVTHAALVSRLNAPLSRLLVASAPVPLVRIVSLTSPLAQFSYIQWFTVIAVILYAGIVTSMRLLKVEHSEVGLRLPARRHLPLEIGVIALGFGLGWMEYQILEPGALVGSLSFRSLAAPILVLYVATGLLEELLFRGIMQRYATEALRPWMGIAFVTVVFAVLHAGWGSWLDILFVGSVGLIYSLVVRKTGSILGVSISHGITNSMLFLVMPFLSG